MDSKEARNPEMLFFRHMMMMMMMMMMMKILMIMKISKLADLAELHLGVGTELLYILHA